VLRGVEADHCLVGDLLARQHCAEAVAGGQDPALVDEAAAACPAATGMVDLLPAETTIE
jgi:hypothetical protein